MDDIICILWRCVHCLNGRWWLLWRWTGLDRRFHAPIFTNFKHFSASSQLASPSYLYIHIFFTCENVVVSLLVANFGKKSIQTRIFFQNKRKVSSNTINLQSIFDFSKEIRYFLRNYMICCSFLVSKVTGGCRTLLIRLLVFSISHLAVVFETICRFNLHFKRMYSW